MYHLTQLDLENCRNMHVCLFYSRAATELKGEVAIHITLRHPNIITLMGVVFEPQYYGIVLEFAPHGDLLHFITKFQPVRLPRNFCYEVLINNRTQQCMKVFRSGWGRDEIESESKALRQ